MNATVSSFHFYVNPQVSALLSHFGNLIIAGIILLFIIEALFTFIITVITNALCKYKVRFSILYAILINPILYFVLSMFIRGVLGSVIVTFIVFWVYASMNKDEEATTGGSAFGWSIVATIVTTILILAPIFIFILKII